MQFTLRFSLLLIIGGFSFLRLTAQKSPEERPNIIFILTDDQSYGYMGCTGNAIVQTPNLDQLAADGTLFTNAHISSAICTPSRVSILTGQFERKHGVNFNSGTSLNQTAWQNTYPMRFRQAGYYTGYVGKNHSPVGKGGYQSKEIEKSFDYWYAGHRHLGFYPKDRHEIFQHAKNDTQLELLEEGINDFLDDNPHRLEGALHFMDQRPAEKPFILSLCFNLPHGAGTSSMEQRKSDPEIYKSLYRDQEIPLPQNYVAKSAIRVPRLPAEVLKADDRQDIYDYVDQPESLKERYIRQLQAMTGIDQLVGRLRDYLKKNGLSDNTIIV
ncbi:MAG: sulfatase-like hydrolase/transferase, partial [Bacteroidota bacterium]